MGRNNAIINGVVPKRGMYLINRDKIRTYGRITHVNSEGALFWFSNDSGAVVRSPDPHRLALNRIEYSARPLPDHVPHKRWPFIEKHPDCEPLDVSFNKLRETALLAAELGRYKRAALLFRAAGLNEAADMCVRGGS